jgi:hypothetical protein
MGVEPIWGITPADFKSAASAISPPPHGDNKRLIASRYQPIRSEATTGFEPVIAVLQTAAFPLGYVAGLKTERAMGFEPTTLSLARRCSTTEPRPQGTAASLRVPQPRLELGTL